jgi:hypothetical protein
MAKYQLLSGSSPTDNEQWSSVITKKLKGNKDKIFICENLTKHRYDMLQCLNTHRINSKVHSYWTHDGSIIVKKSEHSGTKVVRNLEDVDRLALGSLN